MTVLVGVGSFVACGGGDTSTVSSTPSVAAAETPDSDVASSMASSATSPITTPDTSSETRALLVDALPEISGPTVLWFWAPG